MSTPPEARRLRVGVVGCGLIAQVMHLPYLRELADRYEVVALCDLSPAALAFASSIHPEARTFDRWEDVLEARPDVVLVLIGGSHAPIAIAAAEAGMHVFVEKPMCLSPAEGRDMIAAADRGGARLMVGYMKRYDPAYEQLAARLDRESVRLARITTLESPLEPYVAHYPLRGGPIDPALAAQLVAEDDRRVEAAVGDLPSPLRRAYRAILLDSMVHELNAVRGLLGEPDELLFADIWGGAQEGVTATMRFGKTECVFSWVDLPGIARYEQELAFYAPDARATLTFPSPFLRSMPTRLVLEGGEPGSPASWRTESIVSYEEAFKRELLELHAAITEDREPRTPALDGLRDVALCGAIAAAAHDGKPRPRPTAIEAT
ncbi:MAG TPA: Gfo/Idh/MocA family oxidoreductase [Gaiellaceae bacterium]|nr:Gfo/Idh/MocA family oxidoreductase [Gaiellaceae bacterium]